MAQAAQMVDAIPALAGRRGRPRRRPVKLHVDKGYNSAAFRADLRRRGIRPRIARKEIEAKTRLGRHRRVVERSFAWAQPVPPAAHTLRASARRA